MNRNVLYLIIGALAVIAVALGYQRYKAQHQEPGLHIDVGDQGVSIKTK